MPNHIHGVLMITKSLEQKPVGEQNPVGAEHCSAPTECSDTIPKFGKVIPGSISSIIRCYKAAVTKQINLICHTKGQSLIWQQDFYEHIVRNESDLNQIRQYILDNPLRWLDDPENPKLDSQSAEIFGDIPF